MPGSRFRFILLGSALLAALLCALLATSSTTMSSPNEWSARLARLHRAPHSIGRACFAPGTPDDYRRRAEERLWGRARDLPPGASGYALAARWTRTVNDAAPGPHSPITLTYSFIPDNSSGDPFLQNVLHAELDRQFGSRGQWVALIERCLDDWTEVSGVRFEFEPNDDGAPWPDSPGVRGVRGDVRFSCQDVDGLWGILAFAYFPNDGDLTLDSNENWANPAGDYVDFRDTVMHEVGHAIGLEHVLPNDETKLMEPFASSRYDGPQDDDARGANAHYGDRREPNDTGAQATALGAFAAGVPFADLSIHHAGDADWFRVTATPGMMIAAEATPVGSSYLVGPDFGSPRPIDTQRILTLRVDIFAPDGATVLAGAAASGAGATARTEGATVPAGGALLIKVSQTGQAPDVQRYTLTLTNGGPLLWTLSLSSTLAAGVPISLNPASQEAQTAVATPAAPTYRNGTSVTVRAPATHQNLSFARWSIDGVRQPAGERDVVVLMDAPHALVAELTAGVLVEASGDRVIVAGESVPLSAQVVGGTPPYTYQWFPATGLSNPAAAAPIAQPTEDTVYTLRVHDAVGRTGADSVRISVRPALTASIDGPQRVIKDTRITLRASADGGRPPYAFAWSSDGGEIDTERSQARTLIQKKTDVRLSVTDAAGTVATSGLSVEIASPVSIEADEDASVTIGDEVTLEARVAGGVRPYTILWSPGGANGANSGERITVSPLRDTAYVVTASDLLGQQASATIRVHAISTFELTARAETGTIADGETTRLIASATGGQPPYAYEWSPVETLSRADKPSVDAAPTITTRYNLTVTDSIGQKRHASVTVTVEAAQEERSQPGCGFGAPAAALAVALLMAPMRRRIR